MNSQKLIPQNLLNSYVESNRDKIDTALVSLRIIKQIDNFLNCNEINQKELANMLDVSEAYISQLMNGSKKINVKIISKFEKKYDVEFEFRLKNKRIPHSIFESVNSAVELSSRINDFSSTKTFSFNIISDSDYIIDIDYAEL